MSAHLFLIRSLFSDAVCSVVLGKVDVHKWLVGNRRRQQHQSVHYRLTPQWSERSIRQQNNNLQPLVRGEQSWLGVFTVCVCMSVWVCACKLSIGPWATPTHSHVSHSVSERDPVKQSNLCLNWYNCRLAVFILVFMDAYWTWLHRQQSCFCLWGWRLETKDVHNS